MHSDVKKNILIIVVLVAGVLAAYWQTSSFEFTVYDDDEYVYANPLVKNGFTVNGVIGAFTREQAANYHPLTWWSHMLDVELFGLDAGAHHLVNVAIHAVNTALVFVLWLLYGRMAWPAAFVALLFGLHPLHVESVAWVAERKDLLCGFFGILAMMVYSDGVVRGNRRWRWLALLLFVFSLLAKPMLVTMPVLLLLLDYWPLARRDDSGRFPLAAMLREKWCFFLFALLSAMVTLWAQGRGGAIQSLDDFSWAVRLANVPVSYVFYLVKMLWPTGLAVIYPHPGSALAAWQIIGSLVVLGSISAVVWRWRRRLPWLLTGWGWYLISLLPVIGIVQVGYQAVADRYSYLPLIGPFVILVWSGRELAAAFSWRRGAWPAFVLLALVLGSLTWRQAAYWRDSFTLFEHALAVTGRNFVAENHLGLAWLQKGDLRKARDCFQQTLAIKEDHYGALNNLGVVMMRQGRWREAEEYLRRALAINPDFNAARGNLALVLYLEKRFQEAVTQFEESLRRQPDDPVVLDNLANVLLRLDRVDEAIDSLRRSLELDPGFAGACYDLARALLRRGETEEAVHWLRESLRLEPDFEPARRLLEGMRGQEK